MLFYSREAKKITNIFVNNYTFLLKILWDDLALTIDDPRLTIDRDNKKPSLSDIHQKNEKIRNWNQLKSKPKSVLGILSSLSASPHQHSLSNEEIDSSAHRLTLPFPERFA